ncbi:MAG: hypothetical protein HY908_25480 [Myxococcales bacterium]|nr:hypothetical protein [Myxococcales bacterium]
MLRRPPEDLGWVLWDLDVAELDLEAHADSILARVLEHGRLCDVRSVLEIYGPDRIHRFFREAAHPIISERTRGFWRAYFCAEDEPWPSPPAFRQSKSAPWLD